MNKIFNEIIYRFSLNIVFILNSAESILSISVLHLEVINVINFIKINVKYHYN